MVVMKSFKCMFISGKSTFINFLEAGPNQIQEKPTTSLQIKRVERSGVTINMMDLGGQPQFRDEWAKQCKSADILIFCVDLSDVRFSSRVMATFDFYFHVF